MIEQDTFERSEMIEAIRDWLGSVQLVPKALAAYAPLVIEGLLYFLERLPIARLQVILEDQIALGDDAAADDRLYALLLRCPTLHKLGQVISHEAGLSADLRLRLQRLESLVPPQGNAGIDGLIRRELGTVAGLTVARDALAEGSVAYVVPFEWETAPAGLPRRGVFKALKPQAQEHLLEDLAIWPALGDFLEERSALYGVASVDRSTLDGVATLLLDEIRLDREQERLAWAQQFYAASPRVQIPRLLPLCTPHLTAMERIDGRKITESGGDATTRRSLAQTLVEALLAKPFWSEPSAGAVFHADPHAGNVFATSDGRVAIFDWALTTRLSQAQLTAVVQLLLAAATLDEPSVMRALGELGDVRDERRLRATVATSISSVRRGVFPGFTWLTPLLDGLARAAIMTFPQETALFRKSLLTLGGVVRDVSPQTSVDELLIREGGRQFFAESPERALAPFDSRAFGTHLSNADFVNFLRSAPWTPARFMLGAYGELMGAVMSPSEPGSPTSYGKRSEAAKANTPPS